MKKVTVAATLCVIISLWAPAGKTPTREMFASAAVILVQTQQVLMTVHCSGLSTHKSFTLIRVLTTFLWGNAF